LCWNTRRATCSLNSTSKHGVELGKEVSPLRRAEAPQTLSWKVVRSNLWRHKNVCGKRFFSVALLFAAPQTRSFERTLTLKMEAERAPEMLVPFYQDTRCHDPEESNLTYRYTSEGVFS
jgi:hypothetical protein